MMRTALVATSLLLVGGMATACGGAGGAPDNASTEKFCKAFTDAPTTGKPSQQDLDKWVSTLKDTGTPKGISDDERNGFEVLVDALDDADVNDIKDNSDFEDVVKDKGDRADVTKFFAYYLKTCAGGSLPTDIPTGLPSDLPTSLPTDFPSGLPTEFPTSLLTQMPSDFPTSMLTEIPTS
jgi:hypothetical protein